MNSPHKGQWRWALMFSLICDRVNGWKNNGEAGELRRHRTHYDVSVRSRYLKHGKVQTSRSTMWEVSTYLCSGYLLLAPKSPYVRLTSYPTDSVFWYSEIRKEWHSLTHLPLDKMAGISQTTYSKVFSWIKCLVFWFQWSLFLRIQLTIFQHWFRKWLGVDQATSHYLHQCWPNSLTHICGTRGRWVKSGCHLTFDLIVTYDHFTYKIVELENTAYHNNVSTVYSRNPL